MKNIKEIIKSRRSVRIYDGTNLTIQEKKLINDYISKECNLVGKFGTKVKIFLKQNSDNVSGEVGTYGRIVDAPAFLITITKNNKKAMVDLGYVFENLVLYLKGLGLDSCWLSGTFDRTSLSENLGISDDEVIPVISPVGHSNIKLSEKEEKMRTAVNAQRRKPIDSTFFKGNYNVPIKENNKRDIFDFVRFAPSSANLQPWRIILDDDDDDIAHFYIKRSKEVTEYNLPFDTQIIDLGIALSHYIAIDGDKDVVIEQPNISISEEDIEYVFTVKPKI